MPVTRVMQQQRIPVLDLVCTTTKDLGQPQTIAQAKRSRRTKAWMSRTKTPSQRKDVPTGALNSNDKHAQSQDTDCQVLQQSCVSRKGMKEEILLIEENTDRSPFAKGYWDGLSEHTRLNAKEEETGVSEVVEITFARNDKQPPAIEPNEDNIAKDTGIESIAVWTGVVGLITMKEAINTPGDMTIEIGTNTKEHGGDVFPSGGINNNVFNEASEIP